MFACSCSSARSPSLLRPCTLIHPAYTHPHSSLCTRSALMYGGPIGITINDQIASIHFIDGSSMQPAFNPFPDEGSDWVVANRYAGHRLQVKRGDVILLQ